ncbi:hypothetical protein [Marinovum algicola]|uniref:hypothetical protein n=1 Tax=Marinovum algicola TaxID=42444 RepID=UPI00352B44A7
MKQTSMIAIAAILLSANDATADVDCSSIDGAAERLACYDIQSGRDPAHQMEFGNWSALETSTPNGRATVASVASSGPVQCGSVQGPALLTVDCSGDFPQVAVTVPCRAAHPGAEVDAEFQFDDFKFALTMSTAADGANIGTWSNDIQAVRAILGNDAVRVSLFGASVPLSGAAFDLTGGTELMEHLVGEGCVWLPKPG